MKILMVAPFDTMGRYKGGISSVVNNLYDSKLLQSHGFELIKFNTCILERDSSTQASLNSRNIKNSLMIFKALHKRISKEQIDVVYYHTSIKKALLKDLIIIRHAKKRHPNVKIILHIHFADYSKILPNNNLLEKWALLMLNKYADKIIFLSTSTKNEFIKHGIKASKAEVLYNFSTLMFNNDIIDMKKGVKKFLFVGSINQRKGAMDMLSAFKDESNEYELHICGDFTDPDFQIQFERKAQELKGKVYLHGFVNNEKKYKVFQDADVLLLPSYGEGLPVVILEAYSAGCAIVSTKVGAIPEIVSKDNGLLITPGDIESLKKAIHYYLTIDRGVLSKQQYDNYLLSNQFSIKAFSDKIYNIMMKVKNE